MIEVKDLWKTFGGREALRGITFEVPAGSIAGFLGPNGAGKSTTMRILMGYLPLSRGQARVASIDCTGNPRQVARRTGYLPESFPIYPEMRVSEYLAYRAGLRGLSGARRRQAVAGVIDRCALGDVIRQPLGTLSRGYRQRVGLADALLHDPDVLILDEPTAGLDPRQVTEVRRMVSGFRGERTVLLSSHILGEVEQVCDQVIILAEGEIRALESRDGWRRRLDAAGRLRLMLSDVPAGAEGELAALEGVHQVDAADGGFELQTTGDRRGAVYDLCRRRDWSLLELYRVPANLEKLFLEATEKTGATPSG